MSHPVNVSVDTILTIPFSTGLRLLYVLAISQSTAVKKEERNIIVNWGGGGRKKPYCLFLAFPPAETLQPTGCIPSVLPQPDIGLAEAEARHSQALFSSKLQMSYILVGRRCQQAIKAPALVTVLGNLVTNNQSCYHTMPPGDGLAAFRIHFTFDSVLLRQPHPDVPRLLDHHC